MFSHIHDKPCKPKYFDFRGLLFNYYNISSPSALIVYTNQTSLLDYRIYFPSSGSLPSLQTSVNCSGLKELLHLGSYFCLPSSCIPCLCSASSPKIVDNYESLYPVWTPHGINWGTEDRYIYLHPISFPFLLYKSVHLKKFLTNLLHVHLCLKVGFLGNRTCNTFVF